MIEPLLKICRWMISQDETRRFLRALGDPRAGNLIVPRKLRSYVAEWGDVFPSAPRTVVDVGAHTGEFSRTITELYPVEHCLLIEPIPDLAQGLRGLKLPCETTVLNCALGAVEGWQTFHISKYAPASSLLDLTDEATQMYEYDMDRARQLRIHVRTLDDVCRDAGLSNVDLLKIDVQGAEISVLEGAMRTLPNTRMVLAELTFFEAYEGQGLAHQVIAHLADRNFVLARLLGYRAAPSGLPLHCDGLFVNAHHD